MPRSRKKLQAAEVLFIILSAFTAIFICSKSSPLYPFNDWVDANCFMTIGRSMLHGKLPYRDLFEQKGPLLYIIHCAAALFSERSFIGVFIFEVIAAAAYLAAAYAIIREFWKSRFAIAVLPVIAMITYSSKAFCHGDSAEEFCLPLLTCSFLIGLRAVKNSHCLTDRQAILTGILSGCVLWIKFTMLGFFLGFFILPALDILRKKGFRGLLRTIAMIFLGVAAVTFPIFIYFAANSALSDLFGVYFYDNIFRYSNKNTDPFVIVVMRNIYYGIKSAFKNLVIPIIIIIAGVIIAFCRRFKREGSYLAASFALTFAFIFGLGNAYRYYSFILNTFLPISFAVFPTSSVKIKKIRFLSSPVPLSILTLAFSIPFCLTNSSNRYLMKYSRSDMPQFKFADIISETPDATLLNYNFLDGGFYTAAGIIPNCKYFCRLNMEYDEMDRSLQLYVSNASVSYVIVRSDFEDLNDDQNYDPQILEPHYQLVTTEGFPYYDIYLYYHLFKLKETE